MNKSEIIRAWKPELRTLGFVYRDGAFWLKETDDRCIKMAVSVQRRIGDVTYRINTSVLLQNAIVRESRLGVLFDAHVRNDGIHVLHYAPKISWWPSDDLPEALSILKRYALPWFQKFGNPYFLVERVEMAIEHHKSLTDVFEPYSPDEEKALREGLWWHTTPVRLERPAPQSLYYASLLHYIVGNRQMAIQRTQDWLSSLSETQQSQYSQALEQLAALKAIQ